MPEPYTAKLGTFGLRLRHFAFLSHLTSQLRKEVFNLLSSLGFTTRIFSPRFDLDFKTPGVSKGTAQAYKAYKARNERFFGLGIWSDNGSEPSTGIVTITNIGSVLAYPECCVRMDVKTKRSDNQLFLHALVNDVGDNPDHVRHALTG